MRLLVFGSSIAQGYWDSKGGWVARLREYYDNLMLQGIDTDPPIIFNLGVSGDTSELLLKRIDVEARARHRYGDIAIVIAIGLNDSMKLKGKNVASPDSYKNNLLQIIDIASKYSDKLMLIGLNPVDESKTTPVSWCDCEYNNTAIDEFNAIMQKVANDKGIKYVDINKLFKNLDSYEQLLFDGVHPNDKGHEFMYEKIKTELERLLNEN